MGDIKSDQPLLSVVIPLYQEGAYLSEVLQRIRNAVQSIVETYELVLVDDGSPDDTWDAIRTESERCGDVVGLQFSRHFGKESALSAGLSTASGRAVLVMDGDMQHPPELIPEMVRVWQRGEHDIVEALKSSRGEERFSAKIGSQVFYALMNRFSGFDLSNASDFKLLDRKVVDAWKGMGEHHLFFRGMSTWLGFRRAQIPYEVPRRLGGASKWRILGLFRLAVTAITAFSSLPLRLVTVIGGLFFVFALILGVQTLWVWLTGQAVSGFTTTILLLLIIGSLLMISLGIIGEYIARIYDEVKGRPRYIVADTTEK